MVDKEENLKCLSYCTKAPGCKGGGLAGKVAMLKQVVVVDQIWTKMNPVRRPAVEKAPRHEECVVDIYGSMESPLFKSTGLIRSASLDCLGFNHVGFEEQQFFRYLVLLG